MYNPSFVTGQSSLYSSSSKNNQDRFSFIFEPQINWQYVHQKHQLDVLAGGTFQRDVNQQGSMTGVGFESNIFIENIGAAQTKIISDQVRNEYRYAAVFGRLNYQFDHKYILNVTGRRDGSSRFGPNNRFANFGAVGAPWIFSKEKFLEKHKWLSFGKLRGSFGTAGSVNIGDYQYLDTYSISALIYNSVTGLIPSRLYNPDYSWEKTTKLEAAIELGFLRNRINFTGSWYRNRSSNQLIGVQLPALTGFASVLANLPATVENSGIEMELSAFPVKNENLKRETSFNISFPKNKLLSFPNLSGSTYANQYLIGQPTSIIKLYQLEGINPQSGLYQFTDFNGDGKIASPDDNNGETELWNLTTNQRKTFENTAKTEILTDLSQFFIVDKNGILTIYNDHGIVQQTIKGVKNYVTDGKKKLYAERKIGSKTEIIEITSYNIDNNNSNNHNNNKKIRIREPQLLYSTDKTIERFELSPSGKYLLVTEKDAVTQKQNLIFAKTTDQKLSIADQNASYPLGILS